MYFFIFIQFRINILRRLIWVCTVCLRPKNIWVKCLFIHYLPTVICCEVLFYEVMFQCWYVRLYLSLCPKCLILQHSYVYWIFRLCICYRNELYFFGFYRCLNSSKSLTNWVKPKVLYVKFYSNFVIKILFLSTLLHILGADGRKIILRFLLMEFIEVLN